MAVTFNDACIDRVAESLAGESALLDPAVRSDASVIDQLLHPDFAERGQFGPMVDSGGNAPCASSRGRDLRSARRARHPR